MIGIINSIRRIQLKQIAHTPELYMNIKPFINIPHPTRYDESDDIEYQKTIIKKSEEKKSKWGDTTIHME